LRNSVRSCCSSASWRGEVSGIIGEWILATVP
jgi:hypothetical protein